MGRQKPTEATNMVKMVPTLELTMKKAISPYVQKSPYVVISLKETSQSRDRPSRTTKKAVQAE